MRGVRDTDLRDAPPQWVWVQIAKSSSFLPEAMAA